MKENRLISIVWKTKSICKFLLIMLINKKGCNMYYLILQRAAIMFQNRMEKYKTKECCNLKRNKISEILVTWKLKTWARRLQWVVATKFFMKSKSFTVIKPKSTCEKTRFQFFKILTYQCQIINIRQMKFLQFNKI